MLYRPGKLKGTREMRRVVDAKPNEL